MKLKVCLLIVSLAAMIGCGPDETRTEQLRREVDPKVGTFLIQGQRAMEMGQYRIALALSDSAEHYAPELADVDFFRGQVYSALKQYDIAKAAYEVTLQKDPEYRGARHNLGVNAFRRGELRDAVRLLQEEVDRYPISNVYLELGRVYAKLGEADSAQMAYEEALVLDSTNATAHMWIGQLYEELGEFDKALHHSQRGLELQPDDLDYRYIVGSQLFRTGEAETAAEYLTPVAEAWPWHHGAQYNLGQALMRLGEEEQANQYLVRADTAQKLQQAINEAEESLDQMPNDLSTWVDLGNAYRNANRIEEAIQVFQVAATMEPNNLYLLNNLANLYAENNEPIEAIYRYQEILRLNPTLSSVWLNLGVVYTEIDSLDAARKVWERTLQMDPKNEAAREYLRMLDERVAS